MLFYTLLFILLSPGFLLTIPPIGKRILMSGQTSLTAVLVHAIIYTGILYAVINTKEGFNPSWGNKDFQNIQMVASICGGLGFGFLFSSQLKDFALYLAIPCTALAATLSFFSAYIK